MKENATEIMRTYDVDEKQMEYVQRRMESIQGFNSNQSVSLIGKQNSINRGEGIQQDFNPYSSMQCVLIGKQGKQ